MGGRGRGNEGWKRDFGAKVIFFGGRRVHMVFRRMKGGISSYLQGIKGEQ